MTREPGAPPGTLFVPQADGRATIRLTVFGPDRLEERVIERFDDVPERDAPGGVVWVDVAGRPDEPMLREAAARFGLHPLALEDVAHLDQRAKAEPFEPDWFVVARAVAFGKRVETEQITLFVREGVVISFQERESDTFVPIRERLRAGRPRLRSGGADYLAYALLDFVIDSYFPAIAGIDDRLEAIEGATMGRPDESTLRRIQEVRSDLRVLHGSLWPHREMLTQLLRERGPFRRQTLPFLRDVLDHTVQLVELVNAHRELGTELMSVYLSQVSNRMNEVMKVLTMIATVFIPLSFVAGLYGMNFDPDVSRWNMPELEWAYGYPFALGLMAMIGFGIVMLFARKGWFR